MRNVPTAAVAASLLPSVSWAYNGHPEISGGAIGLLHPVTGVKHLLAKLIVGLIVVLAVCACFERCCWPLLTRCLRAQASGLWGCKPRGGELWIGGLALSWGWWQLCHCRADQAFFSSQARRFSLLSTAILMAWKPQSLALSLPI